MRLLVLLPLALMILNSAFAVNLKFTFDINSSGPSIYACDAGIKHAAHTERVCYDRKTGDSCDVGNCPQGQDCNCVCTGGFNFENQTATHAGETRFDYMVATYAEWKDNGEIPSANSPRTMKYAKNNFSRLFSGKNEWNNQLTSLEYNLGSELYGAEMYLDVCYRGPQIDYYADADLFGSNDDSYPNFLLKAQATVTDIVSNNGLRYSELADLKVKVEATCDVQGLGQYVYAQDSNGRKDNALAHTINNDMTGGDMNWVYPENGYTGFNGNAETLLEEWISYRQAFAPRFCKVRYSFIENRRNDLTQPLKMLRKWKFHKAKVCTYTEIEEAE